MPVRYHFFYIEREEGQYRLSDFLFENLEVTAMDDGDMGDAIENISVRNVRVVR